MDVVGKLRHPNVARLKAYYYAKEEKLLVYDYLSNGSLHALLHGLFNLMPSLPFSFQLSDIIKCIFGITLNMSELR
jgi:serine/threonine protein kinase